MTLTHRIMSCASARETTCAMPRRNPTWRVQVGGWSLHARDPPTPLRESVVFGSYQSSVPAQVASTNGIMGAMVQHSDVAAFWSDAGAELWRSWPGLGLTIRDQIRVLERSCHCFATQASLPACRWFLGRPAPVPGGTGWQFHRWTPCAPEPMVWGLVRECARARSPERLRSEPTLARAWWRYLRR